MSAPTVQQDPQLVQLRRYMQQLAGEDDLSLVQHAAGWKDTDARHRAIMIELGRRAKRREQRIAWVAIGVSAVSLLVSIAALLTHAK